MPSTETKIWEALKARVKAMLGGYPLAWPTEDFDSPSDASAPWAYIEVAHLVNDNSRIMIGSDDPHDRSGILQLSLMWPIANKTTNSQLVELAGQIAAFFPTDLSMSFQDVVVRVERAPDVAQAFREEAYWQVPVRVRWRCFA